MADLLCWPTSFQRARSRFLYPFQARKLKSKKVKDQESSKASYKESQEKESKVKVSMSLESSCDVRVLFCLLCDVLCVCLHVVMFLLCCAYSAVVADTYISMFFFVLFAC